ncbi:MAG TPA: N-acetylmuramoyl-L-alanine amidase [Casimicrobiaceae bacterium]
MTRIVRISLGRRRLLRAALLPAAYALVPSAWASLATINSARVWPAQEYTRVILETAAPLAHRMLVLKDPARLVLDLDDADMSAAVATQFAHADTHDPYLAGIRVGRQPGNGLRVVMDLKGDVNPQIFALPPVAEYGYRLVIDIYPSTPVDPLMALLAAEERKHSAPAASAGDASPAAKAQAPDASRRADAAPPRKGKAAAPRPLTIAIDPGHGGEDPGAIGQRGTREKDVVLAIGRHLAKVLDAERGMRTMLTRNDDYFVPLAQRVDKARRVGADLFVSVHADAFRERRARGSSVFALSDRGATSVAAKWLAQKENAADLIGGVNIDVKDPLLARTLLDLSQTAQISDSLKAGRSMLQELSQVNALHRGLVEQAGFAVLKAPDIPSILVETAFISNPDEETKLRDPRQQRRFAESMADGVRRYFAQNPALARA